MWYSTKKDLEDRLNKVEEVYRNELLKAIEENLEITFSSSNQLKTHWIEMFMRENGLEQEQEEIYKYFEPKFNIFLNKLKKFEGGIQPK
jgi:hypothetical protein